MPVVNFNSTTPASPPGAAAINFQSDASGNVSAYVGTAGTWQSWTPALSANNGSFTLGTLYDALYVQMGPVVFFILHFTGTTNTVTPWLYYTLPVATVPTASALPAATLENYPTGQSFYTHQLMPSIAQTNGLALLRIPDDLNWPVGAYEFNCCGFYRCG